MKWLTTFIAGTMGLAFSSVSFASLQKVYTHETYGSTIVSGQSHVSTNKKRHRPAKKIGWQPHYGHPSSMETNGKRTLIVDPMWLTWGAYNENGDLLKMGRASLGKAYCPDIRSRCRTPAGTYAVYRKGNVHCKSSKFPVGRGGAPMPYCMFFKGGYAIHGSPHVPNYNASHGCIRVHPHDAKWLHANFMKIGTKVIVRPYTGNKPGDPTPKPAESVMNDGSSTEI